MGGMPGPAHYAESADGAASARAALDRAAGLVESMEAAQRSVIAALVELWPTSAWIAAGCTSARSWLMAYGGLSHRDAARLEHITELCVRHPRLRASIIEGSLPLRAAAQLARAVTTERAPWLTDRAIDTLLDLATTDPGSFADALAYWSERVDEHLAPRRIQDHSLTISRRLFGGGELHATLAPVSFERVCAAIDAFSQDPDPTDAPYTRTLSERRADALDDIADHALTHHHHDNDHAQCDGPDPDDTYDGLYPGDLLDEALDPANEGLDHLDLLRARLRTADAHQRRRARRQTKPRSGVTVNVHIDLRTLAATRDIDDLQDLVHRGEGWTLTRRAAEQFLCDTNLIATLFDGHNQVLDANTAAERFTRRQRRALAARDHHCVFPGCSRLPKHCDAHHLTERAKGGPTTIANGALLCRFHHRLLHQHHWTLHQDTNGTWTATDPHGTTWYGRQTNHQNAA